ncbi:HCP-like protein, partial [Backusella circina FSU 941]
MSSDEHADEGLVLDPDIVSKAQTGDHSAQLEKGKAYYQAIHIENNCYVAFKWIKTSAEQDNAEAQFMLADMYALGHGVDQNILAAHEWYTKSALQGYPKALIRVHNLYHEDKKIHCRGELNSEEEGMNEAEFKRKNGVRELNEYRLKVMQSENLLGNTMDFFSKQFKFLTESQDKDTNDQYKLGFLYHHGYGVREIVKQAIEWYSQAAEMGHTNAQYNLGCLYQENTDIKFNYRHAFKWFRRAAKADHSAAQNCLAYFFEKGIVVEIDFFEALHWYSKAAANNNKGAMVNMARMYRKGLVDNKPNYSESIVWYRKAAQLGSSAAKSCLYQLCQTKDMVDSDCNTEDTLFTSESAVKNRLCSRLRLDLSTMPDSPTFHQLEKLVFHALVGDGNAMFKIGIKYFNGSNFIQDKETGLKWIQNAAKSGLLKAQLLLGKLYENGRADSVKQDYHKAVICYSLAAKQKNDAAQYRVGLLYYHGHGLRKDPLEASRWFTWSADQDNSDAQYMLGLFRSTGEGLRKDEKEAIEWFTKSGVQRNLQALYQLGLIERRGKRSSEAVTVKKDTLETVVLKKNIKRALLFFKYAADHGCLEAQLLLAKIHDEGDHVNNDSNEAFIYYTQAAKHGNPEAIYRVGYMYLEGQGTKQDYINAYRYIVKAAEKNHPDAKSLLIAPIKDAIKNVDYSKVLKMFEEATLNGVASLEYKIGCLYETGFGDHNSRKIIKANFFQAVYWYRQSAKKNNPEAMYKLGMIYQLRKIHWYYDQPSQFYEKGAKLKHLDSLYALGLLRLYGDEYYSKDINIAFSLFFEAANLGHSESRSVLSLLFGTEMAFDNSFEGQIIKNMMEQVGINGNVIVQYRLGCYYESSNDIKSAIKWYGLAIQGKMIEAYYKLGRIYETKHKFYQNTSRAIELYKTAMDNNHDEAIYRTARLYNYGIGVSQDYEEAFRLYNKAAKLGNWSALTLLDMTHAFKRNRVDIASNTDISIISNNEGSVLRLSSEEKNEVLLMHEYIARNGDVNQQYSVGYIYENGSEHPNYEKAFQWYSMSASSSHKEAMCRLGLLYLNGHGPPQNWDMAAENFKKAMDLGSIEAYYQLGLMYSSGKGFNIDKSKAEQYYILAAKKGHYSAQFTTGKLYESGEVGGKNVLDALKWYTKAYFQGSYQAIASLYRLDYEPDFEKKFYSKLFSKLQRYEGHKEGQLEAIVRDYEYHHKPTGSNDNQFYGYVHYQLGFMHFNGNGTEINYKKAWCHFYQAHKEFDNREALYFMTIEIESINNPETPLLLKKINMFITVISELDGEQLHQLGSVFYNKIHSDNPHNNFINQTNEFAFNFLQKSLKNENPKLKKLIGDMYNFGYGVEADHEKSLQYHIDWANNQDGQANFRTGQEYYNAEENSTIGLMYIIKAANQKNNDAQRFLYDVVPNLQNNATYIKKEEELHKIFADLQSDSENLDVGLMYYYGIGNIGRRHLVGVIYLQRAATQANQVAQRILGDIYYYGFGVEKSQEKAKELHKSASSQLSGIECSRIGQSYFLGSKCFKENHEIAYIYLTESIKKGNYEAGRYLGDIYFSGDVVEVDKEKALELHENYANALSEASLIIIGPTYYDKQWYSIAAIYLKKTTQTDPTVCRYLGNMYYYGKGAELNQEKALKLHGLSAGLSTKAKNYNIGLDYFNGSGQTNKCVDIGLIYINEAINQGYSTAERFIGDKYYYGCDSLQKNQEKALELHR